MKLTIINKSDWPTPLVRLLSKWVVKREGITWDYAVTVRGCRSNNFGGRGGKRAQRVWLDVKYGSGERRREKEGKDNAEVQRAYRAGILREYRSLLKSGEFSKHEIRDAKDYREHEIAPKLRRLWRFFAGLRRWDEAQKYPHAIEKGIKWPYIIKDHRFKWSRPEEYRNRLELLVMLIAHEAHHATAGHPAIFTTGNRTNVASMEFRCNDAGAKAVAAFRADWPMMRDAIRAAMLDERIKGKAMKMNRERSKGPDVKREKAEAALAVWQRKLKLAALKVRKYRRRVGYYERAAAKAAQ